MGDYIWLSYHLLSSQAVKLPAGDKSRRNMARAVARLAAERAAAKIQAVFFHGHERSICWKVGPKVQQELLNTIKEKNTN